jgi:putative hydrolase of HD superfamily
VEHENLIRLLREAGKLKRTRRTGWVEAGVSGPESVADHSYRVALLSMLLSDHRGLDTLKAVRMAILHDLAEAVTGDLTPRQKTPEHGAEELRAFAGLVEGLPTRQRQTYLEAMEEYVAGETGEAALVRAADRLEMVLQALEYEEFGAGADLDPFKCVLVPAEYAGLYRSLLEKKSNNNRVAPTRRGTAA